ncbi:MAG TPA: prolyl oligopeptidase family serine peptidase [Nevskiaceae bacterium]|nr:prolyl oligopeptidase family serine peptidase [Nevskiaceae bacterium]
MALVAGCGSSHSLDEGAETACPDAPVEGTPLESACGRTSWTAGMTELCDGHLVYRDYVYDDAGADKPIPTIRWNPLSTAAPVIAAGDDTYPEGDENTADLVRFELWLAGDTVHVEFELNTLYRESQTWAAVALDTDDDPATGGGTWPGLSIASEGWDEVHVFEHGDPATNRIVGAFPRPAGNAWRVRAAVAQSDGRVMNVAFRPEETTQGRTLTGSPWFEEGQALALARGDINEFSTGVCVDELARGVTRGAPVRTGLRERVYTSAHTLPPGEGLSIDGIPGPAIENPGGRVYQSFNFLGRYQPYAVYAPDLRGPHGLQVLLHGFSQPHTSMIENPGMQAEFGDDLNRVIVSPLGRGLAGAYSDISERDVLDVLDDALGHYAVDPAHVVMSGMSMGGYGTLHFGTLHADRFAGLVGWVSATGNFSGFPGGQPLTYDPASLPANTLDLVANLAETPLVLIYGALDEFVPVFESEAYLEGLKATHRAPFDFYLNANTDHVTTIGFDAWSKEAEISREWRRPATVARVTFRRDPALDVPAYGLVHDRAWWLGVIATRDGGAGDVDLQSGGCGLDTITTEDSIALGAGPVPFVWRHDARRVVATAPSMPEARLQGALTNIASLTIDAAGACVDGAALAYAITTDGPAQLAFSDGRALTLRAGLNEGHLD